ncbi:MAG: clan AA aspartic protease [Deltaproteobacteria bacterium]|nr:clan AA aspartic protease [Deltaproteobacteria bacterium]
MRVTVRSETGIQRDVDAIIDTGFNGFLTLPSEIITELKLSFSATADVVLGDGAGTRLSVYQAAIRIAGRDIDAEVLETEGGSLVGMQALQGLDLSIQVIPDGDVGLQLHAQ